MSQTPDENELMDDEAPGWEAIDQAISRIYGEQQPIHYGTVHPYALGGPDPLDGISIYRNDRDTSHWHYISYGLSELYEKESDDLEISGYGFELTFRLLRTANEDNPPIWVLNLLQNLARYVFQTGKVFDDGHRLSANGPIAAGRETDINAISFVIDPELGEIETPYGHLKFLQVVGIALDELNLMQQWTSAGFLNVLAEDNPLLITDIARKSLLSIPEKANLIRSRME